MNPALIAVIAQSETIMTQHKNQSMVQSTMESRAG